MKKQQTIFAAYHRPIKVKFIDTVDAITLNINRITGTKFTTTKKPLQLIKEMPALKIANNRFYATAKSKLEVNALFEISNKEEILHRQSEFMKEMLAENQNTIKEVALENYNQRYSKEETISENRQNRVINKEVSSDSKTNKIILWVMLIPVFLFIILFVFYFTNN